jgi:hypothetical protein
MWGAWRRRVAIGAAVGLPVLFAVCAVAGQEPKAPKAEQKAAEPGKSSTFVPPLVRLTSAKTVYLKRSGGTDLPYNVISSAIEGWGRYAVVTDPEKADIVIEVSAPDEGGGVTISSSTNTNTVSGRPEQSTSSSRQLGSGGGPIRMVVFDAKSRVQLFASSEIAKSAIKQKTREDNLVEAAQKLFLKFHDRVEPPQQ